MKYIKDLCENEKLENVIYLCKKKSIAVTSSNKDYYNVELQDKTGTLVCKIWDPYNKEIEQFNEMDYVTIGGLISSYNGNLQLSIKTISVASSDAYEIADYLPTSEYDIELMYKELLSLIELVENTHLHSLLASLFIDNEKFIKRFKSSSAAASVHHAFVGGLLEHTLNVARTCNQLRSTYTNLNYDLLITSAILHDVGKVKELSEFPENKFTNEGNLLGHIMIGCELINEKARQSGDFPKYLLDELILSLYLLF